MRLRREDARRGLGVDERRVSGGRARAGDDGAREKNGARGGRRNGDERARTALDATPHEDARVVLERVAAAGHDERRPPQRHRRARLVGAEVRRLPRRDRHAEESHRARAALL